MNDEEGFSYYRRNEKKSESKSTEPKILYWEEISKKIKTQPKNNQIRYYLPYNQEIRNVPECRELMFDWINWIKTDIDQERRFLLAMPKYNKDIYNKLDSFFPVTFVDKISMIGRRPFRQAYLNDNLFYLINPKSTDPIPGDCRFSCIAFLVGEEIVKVLQMHPQIDQLLLLPSHSIESYPDFKKISTEYKGRELKE